MTQGLPPRTCSKTENFWPVKTRAHRQNGSMRVSGGWGTTPCGPSHGGAGVGVAEVGGGMHSMGMKYHSLSIVSHVNAIQRLPVPFEVVF